MPNGDTFPDNADHSERRSGVERDVRQLKRAVYGYPDMQSNEYVDGLVQTSRKSAEDLAAIRGAQDRFYSIAYKGGAIAMLTLFAIVTHQYSIFDVIGRWFH